MKVLPILLLLCASSKAQVPHPPNPYRLLSEQQNGLRIWIIDGPKVRAYIDSEFLYGGNEMRYNYIPAGEIWIDNSITCEEYRYTLAHELYEAHLMRTQGLSYTDAHDSALALEYRMRSADEPEARQHESRLSPVPPIDCDSTQEIASLPNLIRLHDIYRQHFADRDSMHIWIVDGATIRRTIFPDFGFSGDDLAYLFIPSHEIWLDNAMSCEEMKFAIEAELRERALMSRGSDYYSAYTKAITAVGIQRRFKLREAEAHAPLSFSGSLHNEAGGVAH